MMYSAAGAGFAALARVSTSSNPRLIAIDPFINISALCQLFQADSFVHQRSSVKRTRSQHRAGSSTIAPNRSEHSYEKAEQRR